MNLDKYIKYYIFIQYMKMSFDLDDSLYNKITQSAKDNGRNDSAEIRFQLKKIYKEREK